MYGMYLPLSTLVIAGLDPAIHHFAKLFGREMDARVIRYEDALRAFALT
jgi:hypothetical protein